MGLFRAVLLIAICYFTLTIINQNQQIIQRIPFVRENKCYLLLIVIFIFELTF